MAKDRQIACEYYINEKNCKKGHAGIFKKTCQKCKFYRPKKGASPRRKDLRREKDAEWIKKSYNL